MDEEERKRKRVVVEVKESVTTTSTSFLGNTAKPVAPVVAVAPPPVSAQSKVSTALPPSVPQVTPEQPTSDVHVEAPHALLSVQAVPPPVVLPPDVTTASVHVPGISTTTGADAEGDDDDDFEMPEINLESDSEEEEDEQ